MKIIPIQSFTELEKKISGQERSFLLLYKAGAEQSECALERIRGLETDNARSVFAADVNHVRDIHELLKIDSAPSLVIFKHKSVVNIIRGCQTEAVYDSIFAGRDVGRVREEGVKKSRQVTVYTTPTCSWCTTLKSYLESRKIAYREINVASDTAAAEAMVKKSGQQGVPQAEINGQMVVGFDKKRLNQLLEIQ
jgi:glutaredoxin-like YruB-family protein